MKIEFLSKNYNPGDKLKDIISKKVQKLDKFFQEETKIKVMLKQTKDIYTLELTIMADSVVMRAEVSSDNVYNNIDIALPKLEKQIVKHYKKLSTKSKKFAVKALEQAPEQTLEADALIPKLVRSKTYTLVPMSVDDAISELELVGHSFYVFLNKLTNSVNVLYLRNDGDYGLIETVI